MQGRGSVLHGFKALNPKLVNQSSFPAPTRA